DIVNELPNGWREEITLSKAFRPDGSRSQMRKLVDPDGVTREIWHEVFARDGTILHQHQKPVMRRSR
ncbi:MAG: hypothetical protein AB7K36_25555, partial [Chloroflexota bacterium]